MRKGIGYVLLLCACALTTSGCLLPSGQERPKLVVKASTEQSYEMTHVKKGRIAKTITVVATYSQVKRENLSFNVNGKRLKSLNVAVGDVVKAGTVLAELRMDNEEAQFEELSLNLSMKEMQERHLREQMDMKLTQLDRKKGQMSSGALERAKEDIHATYDRQIEDLSDEILIMRMEYERLETALLGSKLIAGMDGIVTSMSQMNYGFVSAAGKAVLSVSDSNVCAFECSQTELIPYFTVGESYLFKASDVTYDTILAEADEAAGIFRFEMKEPDSSLPIGLRVLYSLETDFREDSLYLERPAIHTADGKSYVYYIDENGIRRMKNIEIGLLADNEVEVVSGLSEGEEVILR